MLRFDKGSDVFLVSELINIEPILFYTFIEFIILLFTYLLSLSNFFCLIKKYTISRISLDKFSDVLLVYTCARATDNL